MRNAPRETPFTGTTRHASRPNLSIKALQTQKKTFIADQITSRGENFDRNPYRKHGNFSTEL